MKTSENLQFFYVFQEYRNGTLLKMGYRSRETNELKPENLCNFAYRTLISLFRMFKNYV